VSVLAPLPEAHDDTTAAAPAAGIAPSAVASSDTATARHWVAPSHAPIVIRPRTTAPAADARPPAASIPEVAPKREIDCTSPYFIDDQGMKKVRVECL
jgi:hypothetical protein